MALFSIKNNTKDTKDGDAGKEKDVSKKAKATAVVAEQAVVHTESVSKDLSGVLLHPRVTEKATVQSESGVYVFDVSPRATKKDVAEAVKFLYKVTPRKIAITKVPSKRVRIKGGRNLFGRKSGGKKAYVYVKAGDTIDIV